MGHGKAALGCGDPMGDNMRGFTEDTLVEQPALAYFSDEEKHSPPHHTRDLLPKLISGELDVSELEIITGEPNG
jgi:hypothetical protein